VTPRAAIDLGSHSFLLTILNDQGAMVHDEMCPVGLGRGLGDKGSLRADRMQVAEQVLDDFLMTTRRHGVSPHQIAAGATSAARRATNAPAWFAEIRGRTGLHIRILSGDEEARMTYLGAVSDLDDETRSIVTVDLGGGSTEIGVGVGGRFLHRVSLELGALRQSEAHVLMDDEGGILDPRLTSLQTAIRLATKDAPSPRPVELVVATGGTATTLAALKARLTHFTPQAVHGTALTRADLLEMTQRLVSMTGTERRAFVSIAPDRADTLIAGACILLGVLEHLEHPNLQVSSRGLRFGLLQ
jgi:exopolyphosphatase/guanosine-5'-triphosphate,3'-diphosphate pyrophosphatase